MQRNNERAEPIKEYFIAYFDLLGYKKFFENNPDKIEGFLDTIYEAIENTKGYIQGVQSSPIVGGFGQVSIQVKVFSDNILLCMERCFTAKEYLRFLAFIAIVADIQRNFILQYSLFLRGGITIGTLSFNEDFIFGQGLIDAVALEETAIYPRILVGQTIMDYVLQPHFVNQEDLSKACEIENRILANEPISDDERAFREALMPAVNIEKFYLLWRDHLIFKTFDEVYVLNYLYFLNINTVIDQTTMEQLLRLIKIISPKDYQILENYDVNQKQRLGQHRVHIIQKLREFGSYDDLSASVSGVREADRREYILKKYLWVMTFHNYVCMVYGFPECMIKCGSTCDIRFMRMTIQIYENDLSEVSQINSVETDDK